jgi:enoyl-CoA hydratase
MWPDTAEHDGGTTVSQGYDDLGPDLVVEVRGAVHVVTMNAPERLNSVTDDLHRGLRLIWERVVDEGANAVVLTGAGRAFCAGGHIPDFEANHLDPQRRRREVRNAERLARSMIDCEIPVVAAVNGPAVGLGASLATMSDIVVMSEDAYLVDPHVSVGVVAGDGGAVAWPLLTSLLRAKEHILLGDRLPAARCVEIGLANYALPADQVMPKALELAERLAAKPQFALRDTKRTLNMHLRQAADLALSYGLVTERETFASDDVKATIASFANKQPTS